MYLGCGFEMPGVFHKTYSGRTWGVGEKCQVCYFWLFYMHNTSLLYFHYSGEKCQVCFTQHIQVAPWVWNARCVSHNILRSHLGYEMPGVFHFKLGYVLTGFSWYKKNIRANIVRRLYDDRAMSVRCPAAIVRLFRPLYLMNFMMKSYGHRSFCDHCGFLN